MNTPFIISGNLETWETKKTFNGTRKLFIEPGNMGNKEKPENIGNKEIFNGTRKLFIGPGSMRNKETFYGTRKHFME